MASASADDALVTPTLPGRSARRWPALGSVLLLALIWALLCLAVSQPIAHATSEIGDSAANSLLVQDAKALHLFVGNYSRVGFNHPGPAILYVLAAGEWFFHDVLHATRSPVAGQLIAACFYNAAWIVTAFWLLCRVARDAAVAGLALVALLLAASAWNPVLLTAIWFPDLYFMPFVVVLLATARLAQGRLDAALAHAVSAGVLVNGHVAFIPIVGFMTVAALLIGARAGRPRRASTADLRWLVAGRRRVALAVVVFAVFLVPLAIESVVSFPGPLPRYVGFGTHHHRNNIPSSLRFIGVYWNGVSGAAAVVAAVLVFGRGFAIDQRVRWRGLATMLVVTTVALYLYATFGADHLNQPYLAYFYEAVPASAVAIVVAILTRRWRSRLKRPLVATATVALVVVLIYLVDVPPGAVGELADARVPDLDAAMTTLAGGRRLVLDLDPSADYAAVWPLLAGVATHAKRDGRAPYCVDRGWHILFTRALRCSQADLALGRRWSVRTVAEGAAHGLVPTLASGNVALYDRFP